MQLTNNRCVYLAVNKAFPVCLLSSLTFLLLNTFSYLHSGGTDSTKHQGSTQHFAGSFPCKWL